MWRVGIYEWKVEFDNRMSYEADVITLKRQGGTWRVDLGTSVASVFHGELKYKHTNLVKNIIRPGKMI